MGVDNTEKGGSVVVLTPLRMELCGRDSGGAWDVLSLRSSEWTSARSGGAASDPNRALVGTDV